MISQALRDFLKQESAAGVLLLIAAAAAIGMANSPLSGVYDASQDLPMEVRIGALQIEKPLLLWINDGLMAIFFLLVGLEIKRELLEGELSQLRQVLFPAFAAMGGMAVPAAIYVWINRDDPSLLRGWAIPAATDIAFALGVLALLGKRVPEALTVFLMTVAVLDDLGAIVIIALFYSGELSWAAHGVALLATLVLIAMNLRGVNRVAPYVLVGVVLWIAVLKSGVHATLAGVVLAFTIPLHPPARGGASLLKRLEEDLHGVVAFGILPLFAFANAGVALGGLMPATFREPLGLGIAAGLVIGKPLGVLSAAALATVLGVARPPEGIRWPHLAGAGMLCGIGFTMSLFIGSLAFGHASAAYDTQIRLGILGGSLVSAAAGYALLSRTLAPARRR